MENEIQANTIGAWCLGFESDSEAFLTYHILWTVAVRKNVYVFFYCCLNSLLSTPFVYLYSHLVDSLNSIVYGIFSVSVLYFTLTTSAIKRRIVSIYRIKKRKLLKKGLSKAKHSVFLLMEITFYKTDVGFSCHNILVQTFNFFFLVRIDIQFWQGLCSFSTPPDVFFFG